MRRLLSGLALATTLPALVLPVLLTGGAADAVPARHQPLPRHLRLPDGFQPEGIAVAGKRVLVSSKLTGDIYRFDALTGKGRVFAKGPGTPSLGLKVDARHDRLFVAGGTGGDARVLDLSTGKTLRSYQLTTDTAFVNDAVIRPHAVWFTDSAQAQLYKLPLGRGGRLPKASAVRTVPLTGQWKQVDGNNANGITATPDGKALLVVNSTSGLLYRVTEKGRATRVRLGGATLTNGDGLLLQGRTLLAVRNQDDKIAVVKLDRRGTTGRVTSFIHRKAFDVPSTVAARGDDLYLPNARFSTTPTPTTTYSVTRVRRG